MANASLRDIMLVHQNHMLNLSVSPDGMLIRSNDENYTCLATIWTSRFLWSSFVVSETWSKDVLPGSVKHFFTTSNSEDSVRMTKDDGSNFMTVKFESSSGTVRNIQVDLADPPKYFDQEVYPPSANVAVIECSPSLLYQAISDLSVFGQEFNMLVESGNVTLGTTGQNIQLSGCVVDANVSFQGFGYSLEPVRKYTTTALGVASAVDMKVGDDTTNIHFVANVSPYPFTLEIVSQPKNSLSGYTMFQPTG